MKRSYEIAAGVVTTLLLCTAIAYAQPSPLGPGMNHGMHQGMNHGAAGDTHGPMMGGGMMRGGPMAGRMNSADPAFGADMNLVHDLLDGHDKIKRSVSNLPNGIRTVTESDDPKVAGAIIAHVASMDSRLREGREFNLFSDTIPVLFQNKDKIKTVIDMTPKGAIVTQTSADAKVAKALQDHAVEVSELARDGMVAMMRSAQASMNRGPRR